jgi:hypothetical protein
LHFSMIDTNAVIFTTIERLYDLSPIASVGYGSTTLGSIYHAAAASPFIPGAVGIFKLTSFIICLVLGLLIYIVQAKLRALATPPPKEPIEELSLDNGVVRSSGIPAPAQGGWAMARWAEIKRHMDSPKETEWRFAIIEADKLVDEVLKRAGYAGDTFGERLSNIQPGQLQSLDGLWSSHKVRNRVAHDMNYFLRYTEAKQAIAGFEATLEELEML